MASAIVNLLDFDAARLSAWLAADGESPDRAAMRARQLLRWVHRDLTSDFDAMTNLAKPLRARLAAQSSIAMPAVVHDSVASNIFST